MQKASVRENWFLAWRHQLEATSEEIMNRERMIFFYGFRREVRQFFGAVCHMLRPSLLCCFVVQECKFCHSGSS